MSHATPAVKGAHPWLDIHWRTEDGTGRTDGASLPQLAAISSPWWRDRSVDGTEWQVTTGQVTCSPTQINESTIP